MAPSAKQAGLQGCRYEKNLKGIYSCTTNACQNPNNFTQLFVLRTSDKIAQPVLLRAKNRTLYTTFDQDSK